MWMCTVLPLKQEVQFPTFLVHVVALKEFLDIFCPSTISPGSDGAPTTIHSPASLLHKNVF
jgi:hypothetical protein